MCKYLIANITEGWYDGPKYFMWTAFRDWDLGNGVKKYIFCAGTTYVEQVGWFMINMTSENESYCSNRSP